MSIPGKSLVAPAAVVLALVLAAPASAARNIQVGFADDLNSDQLLYGDSATGDLWAGRMAGAGAGLVRINTYWRNIAGANVPADPTDPADPAYEWSELDAAVRAADRAGLEVLLTVLSAPDYAEAPGRPGDVRPGTWKPRASDFEKFAVALATRYGGTFPDLLGGAGATLPRVDYYEGWNEPNLHLYINPQRKGKKDKSPGIYRTLLNGFYDGIKSVRAANVVVAAGTSPFGDPSGARRIPPVEFWRGVLCLKDKKGKLKFDGKGCPEPGLRAHFDLFTHNSINSPGDGPSVPALDPDNATAADMYKMVDLIRAAEKFNTVLPAGEKRKVWSTELWYESNPPEKQKGKAVPLGKQARYMAEALYVLWEQKVSAGIFLQIRDTEYTPGGPAVLGLQSGVYFFNETAKPSLDAVSFPFVADRKSKGKVRLWAKSPAGGKIEFERKQGKRWKRVARKRASPGAVTTLKVKQKGEAKFRASIGGERSRTFPVGKK